MLSCLLASGLARGSAVVLNTDSANAETFEANCVFVIPIGNRSAKLSNEASWTQVLEVIEFMSDATSIPILLDGDTGYGNFNNVQRLIKKLEQRQIAGVCLEDKLFPKTNSFINGEVQPLADIDEFCGKIKAAKDAQNDDEFVLIARVEALITGWGLSEALKRAEAYHQAGADGILMHSALRVPDEILAFKREWGDRCPVVIVPTKYYSTPTEVFRKYGFALVIWANHLLRAAIASMQQTAQTLIEEETLLNIEKSVVPVTEIFRLQGAEELLAAEKLYLPQTERSECGCHQRYASSWELLNRPLA
jgi:phosphoenolpyruvate phosphomutase